jgi:hypothetical protein
MPFKKDPKIKTPDDPGSDKKLPVPGPQIPLNVIHLKRQIIEYVDGDIMRTVTGNVDYKVMQDLTTKIEGNDSLTVVKKQTIEVDDSVEHTIGQDFSFTVHGSHNEVHVGPQNLTFLGAQTESREGPQQKEESTATFEVKPTDMAMVWGFEFAMNTGIKIDLSTILSLELANLTVGLASLSGEAKMGKAASEALEAKMQGLANKIMGIKAEAGGAEAKALPDANAAPGVSPAGIVR